MNVGTAWIPDHLQAYVEGHKFLFVAKTFHVPFINLKMK
jgi:hypothetical protein